MRCTQYLYPAFAINTKEWNYSLSLFFLCMQKGLWISVFKSVRSVLHIIFSDHVHFSVKESWEGFAFDTGRCDTTRALPWKRERKQVQETRENYKHALCFCREKIDVSKALITNRLQSSVITGLLKVPSPMHEALHQDWEWLLIPSRFLSFCCFNWHKQKSSPSTALHTHNCQQLSHLWALGGSTGWRQRHVGMWGGMGRQLQRCFPVFLRFCCTPEQKPSLC